MWEIISSISTGTALVAFLAAVVSEILRRRLKHKEIIIESTPQEDRGAVVLATLEAFSVDTSGLTREQRYLLAMELIQKKTQRFKIVAIVVVVLAMLATGLSVYAISKSNKIIELPKDELYSFNYDNQTIIWAVSFLDRMSKEFNITLHKDIKNETINTNRFSLHLENAKLEDILDSICAKASKEKKINWKKSGKNILVYPIKDTSLPKSADSSNKMWGITAEYVADGDDVIEGWLTAETLTWGAIIPLPPFSAPPKISFWRNDGARIDKPKIVENTTDQFSIRINSMGQAGKWMWRARGTKSSSIKNKEKMTSSESKNKYLIQSYNSLELYNGDLTITLSSTVQYANSRIKLTISTKGKESKTYTEIAVGEKIFHENYEITFIKSKLNISVYDVLLRVIKTN